MGHLVTQQDGEEGDGERQAPEDADRIFYRVHASLHRPGKGRRDARGEEQGDVEPESVVVGVGRDVAHGERILQDED